MRRRSGAAPLLAALVLLPLSGAPAAAQPAAPASVKVAVMEGTQLFPLHVLQTKGIAEKHQLRIEQTKAAGLQKFYTVLGTGEFHVAFASWPTIAVFRAAGQKLANVYSVSGYANDVMVPAKSTLKSFGDLKGKRIGVFGGPTATTTWFFRLQMAKFFGFDPTKEAKVTYGASALLMGMLEKGELDALLSLDPQIVQMLETGKFRSIGNTGQIWRTKTGQDPLLLAVTVNEEWAQQNVAVVRRFVAAYREALEYLKTRADVWPELARSVGIKTERGARLLRERSAFLSRWDQRFIDEQHAFAAEVAKTFGDTVGVPKRIPEGTFNLSYAQ